MKNIVNNKWVLWIIGILVLANMATMLFFWLGRIQQERIGSPREFLAAKLQFDETQKTKYFDLAKEHHDQAQKIRAAIKGSKDQFFDLLKETNLADSTLQLAAAKVSERMKELDLYTFEHFKKVRALCNPEQQKRFDELIHQITGAVSDQNRPLPPNGPLNGPANGPQNGPPNGPPMGPEGQPMPQHPPQ